MNKQYMDMWHIKNGLSRVRVYPMQQERSKRLGPITVYRDEWGVTYSAKYIREWGQLTPEQKSKAYRDAYQESRQDALWRIEKDPSLESSYESWKADAKAERDAALDAIARGESVQPPKRIWE